MHTVLKYQQEHERELLSLLAKEPDWQTFLTDDAIETFKAALLTGNTWLSLNHGRICGYLRALVDGFGVYVSELYVAPEHRGQGFGAALLAKVKQQHPNQVVYVLSDEDGYYEKRVSGLNG